MNGSLMHSYFAGTLQDGGVLLFILIAYLLLFPIILAVKRKTVQVNITKIVWIIAVVGSLATNTWMYDLKIGPIYAYIYSYAAISVIRVSAVKSEKKSNF